MDAEVVVIGDVNPDLVLHGDVVPRFGQAEQLIDAAELMLGGSGAIVAAGLARLGHSVALIAAVGDDSFASMCLDLLAERGVRVDGVVRRRDSSTGLSVVLSHGERALLTYPGAIATLGPGDLDPSVLVGAKHVHSASFYLTPLLHETLPTVLAQLRQAGTVVSVDTNDDPGRRWADLGELLAAADVALPNEAEVVRWSEALAAPGGHDAAWRSAAHQIGCFIPTVVVKTGAHGGTCVRRGASDVSCAPPDGVEPLDSTGAGDSFDAAWISATLRGLAPEIALRWAVTAGSLSTRAAGGTAAQPTLPELTAALETVGSKQRSGERPSGGTSA